MLGWPKRCKLAHPFLWEYSCKGLELAQLLGQLGVFLTLTSPLGFDTSVAVFVSSGLASSAAFGAALAIFAPSRCVAAVCGFDGRPPAFAPTTAGLPSSASVFSICSLSSALLPW